jgi:hypothetical protein
MVLFNYIRSFINSSTALCWTLAFSSSFVISFTQTVGLLGWVISPSQGRYLYTRQHKHRINAHTNINALNGIRTNNPSVRASEDSSCLRPRGHCDWRIIFIGHQIKRKHFPSWSELLFWEETLNHSCNRNILKGNTVWGQGNYRFLFLNGEAVPVLLMRESSCHNMCALVAWRLGTGEAANIFTWLRFILYLIF